jgi:hypothetical protein
MNDNGAQTEWIGLILMAGGSQFKHVADANSALN